MLIKKISFKQVFIGISFFLLLLICVTFNYPIGDFGNYFFGSKLFLNGQISTQQIYEPFQFNLAIYDLGYRNFFLSYTQVPPITLLCYLPFCWFNILYAKLLWNILNAILFLWLIYRVKQKFKVDIKHIALIPFIFFQPLLSNFTQGQSYILIIFLLLEGYHLHEKDKSWMASFLWSIAILLKVFPAIILLFLLFNNNIKTLFKCIFICLCITFFSIPFIGYDVWQNYLLNILPRLYAGEINNTYTPIFQSFQVLVKNMFVPDLMHNPDAPFDSYILFNLISLGYKILILIICIGITLNKKISSINIFASWIFFGILLSGYGSTYGLLMLFIPFISVTQSRYHILLLSFVFLIANIPVHNFLHLNIWFQFPRLYLLIIFSLLWIYINKPILKWYYLLLFLPILFIKNSRTESGKYFLNKEEALLIYDFKIINDTIQLSFIDNHGPQKKIIPMKIHVTSIDPYRYMPSYPSRENVLKSVLINKRDVVYLSDQNRGVGFYTLRIFNIK